MKPFWTILFALPVTLATALAQAPSDLFEKAPPDVDQSLRERVTAFYQCHIDGAYRKAEKYVAEESQDYFYQIQKQRYDSCKTLKITYSDNFSKAIVTQVCKGNWNISGSELKVEMPLSSTWARKDGGEWFWKHVPPSQTPSPFGGSFDYNGPGRETPAAGETKKFGGLNIPTDMKAAGEMLQKQVTVDKMDIKLSSYENSEDTITIANNSGGTVQLAFEYEAVVPGLKVELDKKEVPAGGKANLKLTMTPKDRVAKPTLYTRLLVEPLLQQFPIRITFAIPPEIEKQIPKK